jgi:acetyl-CoA acetyltransferase
MSWPAYQCAIAGVGETAYEWKSSRAVQQNILAACRSAIDDAGLSTSDIDGVAIEGSIVSHFISPDELMAGLGVREWNYQSAGSLGGAGTVAALEQAALAIAGGSARAVLCYFGVDWGANAGDIYDFHGRDPYKRDLEVPHGFYGQPSYFAVKARRYASEYGLTPEQLGGLAISTRAWASLHPGALRREPMTMDDYLQSRMISTPLRVADCCIINDGAAAFVVTSAETAQARGSTPVYIAGVAQSVDGIANNSVLTQGSLLSTSGRLSGPLALERAGLTIRDIDLFEIYDCFTISCLIQIEDLGICRPGEAAGLVGEGRTGPGGDVPVNTHGGLLSHSYMVGINHVVEAVRQLRHSAGDRQVPQAEAAVVTGYGSSAHATAVLTHSARRGVR